MQKSLKHLSITYILKFKSHIYEMKVFAASKAKSISVLPSIMFHRNKLNE